MAPDIEASGATTSSTDDAHQPHHQPDRQVPALPAPSVWSTAPVRPIPGSWSKSQTAAGLSATSASFAAWGDPPHGRSTTDKLKALYTEPEASAEVTPPFVNRAATEDPASAGPVSAWQAQWPQTKTASALQSGGPARERLLQRLRQREQRSEPADTETGRLKTASSRGARPAVSWKVWNRDAILRLPPPPPAVELPFSSLPWGATASAGKESRSAAGGAAAEAVRRLLPDAALAVDWDAADLCAFAAPLRLRAAHALFRSAAVEATALLWELCFASRLDTAASAAFDALIVPWVAGSATPSAAEDGTHPPAAIVPGLLVACLHPPIHPHPGWEAASPIQTDGPGDTAGDQELASSPQSLLALPFPTPGASPVRGATSPLDEGTIFRRPGRAEAVSPAAAVPARPLDGRVLAAAYRSVLLLRHAQRVRTVADATAPGPSTATAKAAAARKSAPPWAEEARYALGHARVVAARLVADSRPLARELRREMAAAFAPCRPLAADSLVHLPALGRRA